MYCFRELVAHNPVVIMLAHVSCLTGEAVADAESALGFAAAFLGAALTGLKLSESSESSPFARLRFFSAILSAALVFGLPVFSASSSASSVR